MPRTIEHPIRLLNRPSTPPLTAEYGTITKRGAGMRQRTAVVVVDNSDDTYNNNNNNNNNWWRNTTTMGMGAERAELPPPQHYYHQQQPKRTTTTTRHFQSKHGDEMTFGTESFERNLRYSPNEIERQHFSCRKFDERNTFGDDGDRGEESRASVRFEDQLSPAPQAPLEPLKPIGHTYESRTPFAHPIHWTSSDEDDDQGGKETNEKRWTMQRQKEEDSSNNKGGGRGLRMLPRTPHLDTTPIRIPRPKLNSVDGRAAAAQAASLSPASATSWHTSSSSSGFDESNNRGRSGRSSSAAFDERHPMTTTNVPFGAAMPMKKVIRKSRWVSIHTGRPVSKFVESVHYEPADGSGGGTSSRATNESRVSAETTAAAPFAASDSQHQRRQQTAMAHFSPELWTSSSSCSLSSNDECTTRGNQHRGGGGGGTQRQRANADGDDDDRLQRNSMSVTQNPVYPFGDGH